jgi:HAMP domain-containing protein
MAGENNDRRYRIPDELDEILTGLEVSGANNNTHKIRHVIKEFPELIKETGQLKQEVAQLTRKLERALQLLNNKVSLDKSIKEFVDEQDY